MAHITQDKPIRNDLDHESEEAPASKFGSPVITESSLDFLGESGASSLADKNPFSNPDIAAHWRNVYEDSHYECRHVFDPALTWTEEEEKKLIRRLDWRVCLWACVMFFGLQYV